MQEIAQYGDLFDHLAAGFRALCDVTPPVDQVDLDYDEQFTHLDELAECVKTGDPIRVLHHVITKLNWYGNYTPDDVDEPWKPRRYFDAIYDGAHHLVMGVNPIPVDPDEEDGVSTEDMLTLTLVELHEVVQDMETLRDEYRTRYQ